MCDTWGDPCRCPVRATDVARRRDVDKEVSRGRSRHESAEGPNSNLNLSVESAETANSATVAIKVEEYKVDRLGRKRTESEPEGERPGRSE